MDTYKKEGLFKCDEDAQKLLQESRKRIDEIDNDLFDLIHERTSLAKDIVCAKVFLGMEIYDENREKEIHSKVLRLAKEKGIDARMLSEIMNILTILSKNKQKEILEE